MAIPFGSLLPRTSRLRTFVSYSVMLGATAVAYLWIRAQGEQLEAPAATGASAAERGAHSSDLAHLLLALGVITLLARVVGGACRRLLGQPPVIGEILAGILLGPSVLGALWPEAQHFLLPESVAPALGVVSKIGVVLFMFLVGLDLDPRLLRGNTHSTIAVSHASIVAPFLLGATLALWLYPLYSSASVGFTAFSLFLGVSLSITAFPVLARILRDRRVQGTRLGVTALACAAVDDVSAWTLLALVVGIATATMSGAVWTIAYVAAYVALMMLVVRPLMQRWFVAREERYEGPLSHSALAFVFVALLGSALATEWIGIHALFGAFLLGAILPNEGRLARELRSRIEDVVLVLFLPSFFAFTGMRTSIGLVEGSRDWMFCGLIVLTAVVGKFGGSLFAARLTGMSWRHSAALGVLMNTRGLMELIVLNLGLDLGVISPTIFTMMVIMALVTTFMTTPLLDLLLGRRGFGDPPPDALPARTP
ncbi:MAG: cation:proton antiporter [Planctomycetota bacterium]|nr:cation:proton antiporter [Planctomycetota bacterium]